MGNDALTRLRWVMLPVLAAALFVPFYEGLYRLARWALDGGFDGAAGGLYFAGQALVPLLVALLACYPLARLYAGQAMAAGAIIGVSIAAYLLSQFTFDDPAMVTVLLAPLELCLLMPLMAGVAQRSFRDGPHLAWRARGEGVSGERAPVRLAWVLLPLLGLGFFMLHDVVQPLAMDLAVLSPSPTMERAAMLVASPAGPALVALPVAYAAACLYGRRASWIGALIVLPTVWKWAAYYLSLSPLPTTRIVFALEVLGLALFVPLFAAWIASRLGDGGLVLVPPSRPDGADIGRLP